MQSNKVVLVTGAASGIGRACALRLAEEGYQVAINYRSKQGEAEGLLAELKGVGHYLFQADLADAVACESMITSVLERYGRIDGLVNAAGDFSEQPIANTFAEWQEAWRSCIDINLMAAVNLCYLVAGPMQKQASGKIVNITSRGAFRGEPTAPAYGAAKSALNSASQSLAVALAAKGVCVYAIAPGWVETPMAGGRITSELCAQIPLGRAGKPEEIANLTAFLIGPNTEYLTGAIIDANGASYLRN